MIVKCKSLSNPEVWNFFDGVTHVTKEWHPLIGQSNDIEKDVKNEFGSFTVRNDVYDFINNRPCSEDEAQGGVIELWLYGREKDDIRQILCFRPAYLINDEGKTIERF